MILLEPAHKILHTTVKFKRRTISVTRLCRSYALLSRLPVIVTIDHEVRESGWQLCCDA
jgi:hypothetical protein